MSWEWWEFVKRVDSFIDSSTTIIWNLSPIIWEDLENTIRKLKKAKEAVAGKDISPQDALWLNKAFDDLFDGRRTAIIGILTNWFSDLNETDIKYIKGLFRLNTPWRRASISNQWLARILNWDFTKSDLSSILEDLPYIDKDNCLTFISWKVWVNKSNIELIRRIISWSFSERDLLTMFKLFDSMNNGVTKRHIVDSIWMDLSWIPLIKKFLDKKAQTWDAWVLLNMFSGNKNVIVRSLIWKIAIHNLFIFSIDDLLTLLRLFWDVIKWAIFKNREKLSKKQRDTGWWMNTETLRLLINNFRSWKIDPIEILRTFSFLNENIVRDIIKIILWDSYIHDPDRYRIINILWEDYWYILWEILWLTGEVTKRVTDIIIQSRRYEHSLATKYEILMSIDEPERYRMFWILLWDFSVEMLEDMKSQVIWERRRKWAVISKNIEREVAENIWKIIWITDLAQLERTSLERYFLSKNENWTRAESTKETALARAFRFLSWLPWFLSGNSSVNDLSWETRNSLREVWIWEWNISTIRNAGEKEFTKLLWVVKWCKYEWRKVIIEWFLRNKWIKLNYWRLVDCFIMDGFISGPEIFSEKYFKKLVSADPNNIDIVRNIRCLWELYWISQNLLSPSIIRMIATLSPKDFEESIKEIKVVWIDINKSAWFDSVDISSMALLIKYWNNLRVEDFSNKWLWKSIWINIWTDISRRRNNIKYLLRNHRKSVWIELIKNPNFLALIDNFDTNTLTLFEELSNESNRKGKKITMYISEINSVIFAWTKQLTTWEERKRDTILSRYNAIWENIKFWNISTDFLLRNANNPFFASSNTIAFIVALIRAWLDGAFKKVNWDFIVNEEDIEKIIKEWSKYAYLLKNDIHILIWNKYVEDKNNN